MVFLRLLAGFLALILTACASTSGAAPGIDAGAQSGGLPAERIEYRLDTGDQLRIIVFGEEELSGEFVVDSSGGVSLPLIGQVDAQGLTLREFERAVREALQEGYLNDPRVNAEVLNFRPYYILGEVQEPGEYPYNSGLTVMNAVATAGGFTYRANTRVVYIKRAGSTRELEFNLTPETTVNPGDTVRIAERFF